MNLQAALGDPHGAPGAPEAEWLKSRHRALKAIRWDQQVDVYRGAGGGVHRDREPTGQCIRDPGGVEGRHDADEFGIQVEHPPRL